MGEGVGPGVSARYGLRVAAQVRQVIVFRLSVEESLGAGVNDGRVVGAQVREVVG